MKDCLGVFLFFVSLLLTVACNNPTSVKKKKPLPNTPETVLRQWQQHVDKNEFEEARALSSPSTSEWLDVIASIIFEEPDSAILMTQFDRMECITTGDSAICTYTIQEEEFLIDDTTKLVRMAGQWKVDYTDEGDELLDEEDMKAILDEMEELLQEEEVE